MASYNNLPSVEAELNYLGPMTQRPRYYTYDLEPGVPCSNATHQELVSLSVALSLCH